MFENKKKFFNFAQLGVHISNSIQNLVDRESLDPTYPSSPVPQLNYEEIHEEDSSMFNVENQIEDEQNECLLNPPTDPFDSEENSSLLSLEDLSNFNQPDVVRDANRTFATQHTDV